MTAKKSIGAAGHVEPPGLVRASKVDQEAARRYVLRQEHLSDEDCALILDMLGLAEDSLLG